MQRDVLLPRIVDTNLAKAYRRGMDPAEIDVTAVGRDRWKFVADVRGWVVHGHVKLIDGRPLITGLHFDLDGPIPNAGLTTDDLRAVRSSAIFDAVRWFATDTFDPEVIPAGSDAEALADEFRQRSRGKKSRSELTEADQAIERATAARAGSAGGPYRGDARWRLVAETRLAVEADPDREGSVTEAVAERLGRLLKREVPLSTVKTYMKRAADAGWLAGLSQGRRGAMPGPRLIEARLKDEEGGR